METIKIKGKDYITVNERVKEFRATHPDWSIKTELIRFDENSVIIKAEVTDENGNLKASGFAQEFRNDKTSMVNATNYVENCETSAVGRALGFLGIGIDTSIASADEVKRAIEQQEEMNKQSDSVNAQILQKAKACKNADEVLILYNENKDTIDESTRHEIIQIGSLLRSQEKLIEQKAA